MFAASAVALLPLIAGQVPPAPKLGCSDLHPLINTFQANHYARDAVAPVAENRSVEQFIKALDPSKMLLLEKDVKRLRKDLPRVFSTMRDGNCVLLDKAGKLVVARAKADEKYARELLGPTFKLDESVKLVLDADKRGYAKTEAERKMRLRDMVHFQISNFLLAEIELAEAKKKVIHRYELTRRRLSERRASPELPGLYASAFAAALDPHSSFLSAETLQDFQINMHLSLEGIGAVLRSEDGFTVIQSLVPGGQADKQGQLRPKDKITAVAQDREDPVDVIDLDLRDVVRLIRGKKGTKVVLTVLREGKKTSRFDVTIVRDKIDVKEQAAKITYETIKRGKRKFKIGILDLPSFYGGDRAGRSSYRDVKRLLAEANEQKVDGLVLDLTHNGGGLLEDAVRISGLFIREGAIVATKEAEGDPEFLRDHDVRTQFSKPLAVLISPVSASASEILAGALRDYRRAIIVGSKQSFGKGTVQKLQPLPGNLGAMKVTTGMFFLPSGASTQQRGVASHLEIPSPLNGYDIGEKNLDYSLPPQSVLPFVSSMANGRGKNRWRPVTRNVVSALEKNSKRRVSRSPEMKEIKKRLKEDDQAKDTITLKELRAKAKETDTDDEKSKEDYDNRVKAVVMEAAEILTDFITLKS